MATSLVRHTYTAAEVAAIIGVDVKTVYALGDKGRIKRLGDLGRALYSASSVHEYVGEEPVKALREYAHRGQGGLTR
jgi:hypothetical protein